MFTAKLYGQRLDKKVTRLEWSPFLGPPPDGGRPYGLKRENCIIKQGTEILIFLLVGCFPGATALTRPKKIKKYRGFG